MGLDHVTVRNHQSGTVQFFPGAGSRPPSVVFCPSNRRDGSPKDTLRNIQETQEFVIDVVPFRLAAAMHLSSSEVPDDESEFVLTGMTASPSTTVKPPRVAESPVSGKMEHLTCRTPEHCQHSRS